MGNVLRFYVLCSCPHDVEGKLRLFFRRLLARGYKKDALLPVFSKAVANAKDHLRGRSRKQLERIAEHAANLAGEPPKARNRIFFHVPFHPQDPRSSTLQRLWRSHVRNPPGEAPLPSVPNRLNAAIGVDQMTVAYSRAPNLGNLLSYRRFDRLPGPAVSSFFD